jgi:hypothetical protein
MALTVASLIVYTTLSLSRNADELSATFHPSTLTQTLTIASRVAAFAPMMCMLFVGCRMYVLATTEGLGEPPLWVKRCMWLAVGGMGMQFLGVILLPMFTKRAAAEEAAYDMTEGHEEEIEQKKAKKEAEKKQTKSHESFYMGSQAESDKRDFYIGSQAESDEDSPDAFFIGTQLDTDGAGQDVAPVHELTGEQNDVHPALGSVEFENKEQSSALMCFFGACNSSVCCAFMVASQVLSLVLLPSLHRPPKYRLLSSVPSP